MFLGYQNDLIAVAAKTKEEVESSVGIKFTKIVFFTISTLF